MANLQYNPTKLLVVKYGHLRIYDCHNMRNLRLKWYPVPSQATTATVPCLRCISTSSQWTFSVHFLRHHKVISTFWFGPSDTRNSRKRWRCLWQMRHISKIFSFITWKFCSGSELFSLWKMASNLFSSSPLAFAATLSTNTSSQQRNNHRRTAKRRVSTEQS